MPRGGPPVLWLNTNALQLTVPIGDDGQLMSGAPRWQAPPMASYKCSSISARSFLFFFCIPFLYSSDFFVHFRFLLSARQQISSLLGRWVLPKHRHTVFDDFCMRASIYLYNMYMLVNANKQKQNTNCTSLRCVYWSAVSVLRGGTVVYLLVRGRQTDRQDTDRQTHR